MSSSCSRAAEDSRMRKHGPALTEHQCRTLVHDFSHHQWVWWGWTECPIMPDTTNKEQFLHSSRLSLERGDGKGTITVPKVSLAGRLCHPWKMKMGNKTKVSKALLVLGIDFGKTMESGWSFLNYEALNSTQGFSKSSSLQRFETNGGKGGMHLGANCEPELSSYVSSTLRKEHCRDPQGSRKVRSGPGSLHWPPSVQIQSLEQE